MNHTNRWSLAAGTTLVLALASPAAAAGFRAGAKSGGPGTLGTEVPFDSREAEIYYHVSLPTDTPEALRIRDGIQRLHAAHEGAIALADVGLLSVNPQVRALAQRIGDDHARVDEALRKYFQTSRFPMSGTAYAEARQSALAGVHEVQSAEGSARDTAFLARAGDLLERTVADVDALVPQARKARRQVLTSHLERERKLMRSQLEEVRALEGAAGVGAGHG